MTDHVSIEIIWIHTKIEACDDIFMPAVSFNNKPNSDAFIIGLAH